MFALTLTAVETGFFLFFFYFLTFTEWTSIKMFAWKFNVKLSKEFFFFFFYFPQSFKREIVLVLCGNDKLTQTKTSVN